MTGKNNEELLNIYDDQNSDDLFATNNESKKEISDKDNTLTFDDSDIKVPELDIIDENNKDNSNIIEEKNDLKKEEVNIIEDDIDEWFMDEINELKDDVKEEKKSFFWNLFKKKEKIEDTKIDDLEEKKDELEEEKSLNIFDDFNQDDSLLEEVDQIKQDRDRDIYYYFAKAWKVLQVIFVLWLLLVAILYSYIYVQNKIYTWESKDNQLLWPFCFILLNWVDYDLNDCTSIATLKDDYTNKLSDVKVKQSKQILNVVKWVYEIENFTKTKDVIFLNDKTEWKLKVLKILEEFDNLKNEFASVDKQIIQCQNIKIDQVKEVITMNCNAYSAWFESWIRWFDGKNEPGSYVKWTSISIANSFLNFISLESKTFTIIDRQKLFKSDSIVWSKTGFTSKTPFVLKLKYNLD